MSSLLDGLGAAFGTRRPNARSTAALLSNPGCSRRAVLDAAAVDLGRLAERLGSPARFGQSPFALGQGNRFEQRIKENGHAALATAIDDLLGIFAGLEQLTTVNLERVPADGRTLIQARAEETAKVLRSIAEGDTSAPHVIDHGVTRLSLGDATVYLEQDALAFREGSKLRVCEVKGFPIIDGTASPTKVGAAARQTAVYVASIQDTLEAEGLDPALVSPEVVLICPKNFSITPVAVKLDVSRELRALRRQIARFVSAPTLARDLAAQAKRDGVDLRAAIADAVAAGPDDETTAQTVVDVLPYRYAPECLNNCDLARHCRSEAQQHDDPAVLGGEAANLAGSVGTIAGAVALADEPDPGADEAEVAAMLRAASLAEAEVWGS